MIADASNFVSVFGLLLTYQKKLLINFVRCPYHHVSLRCNYSITQSCRFLVCACELNIFMAG